MPYVMQNILSITEKSDNNATFPRYYTLHEIYYSHIYKINKKHLIKISRAISEECNHKHRDTRFFIYDKNWPRLSILKYEYFISQFQSRLKFLKCEYFILQFEPSQNTYVKWIYYIW